jgi:hypothetical protein
VGRVREKIVRRRKMLVCEEVEKARHTVFSMFCGSRRLKRRLRKAAGAEPSKEKLHAVEDDEDDHDHNDNDNNNTYNYSCNYNYTTNTTTTTPELHYNALHYIYYVTLRYAALQSACIGARFCFLEKAVFCCHMWSTASYAKYRKWSFEHPSQTTLPSQTCIYTALPMKEKCSGHVDTCQLRIQNGMVHYFDRIPNKQDY